MHDSRAWLVDEIFIGFVHIKYRYICEAVKIHAQNNMNNVETFRICNSLVKARSKQQEKKKTI